MVKTVNRSIRVRHFLGARIETDSAGLYVIGHYYARECCHGHVQRPGEELGVVPYGEEQTVVVGLAEE